MNGSFRVTILLICLLIGFESQASAYTDPGTTALIWQMLAAGFVGAMFYFRRLRTAITGIWKKRSEQ
jgi:hypothetical protein